MSPEQFFYSLFPDCREKIDKAIRWTGGRFTAGDLGELILQGKLVPWREPGCCLLTEIAVYPRLKALNIVLAAGHRDGLGRALEAAEVWARAEHGCTRVEGVGRFGWTRLASRNGWHVRGAFVEREII
jgi:hypothetical protein